jgi:hypothetical protein
LKKVGNSQPVAPNPKTDTAIDFNAVAIGAGISGLYQFHRLREAGLVARCLFPDVFKYSSAVAPRR